MTIHASKRSRLLFLSLALAPAGVGCASRPETYHRPDLAARIEDGGEPEGGSPDEPAREAVARRPAAGAADASIVRASAEEPAAAKIEEGSEGDEPGAGAPTEPLTLERARELAMQHSPVLRGSVAAIDSSAGDLEVVRSGFKPSFLGSYSYQGFTSDVGFVGNRGRFPVLPVRGFGPGAQNFHVSEVQMKWTIYQFGRLLSKERQARFKIEVARLEAERSRQSVEHEVARTYFQVLEATTARRIADRAVDRAEAYRREAGDLLGRGAITREQLLRVDADLATARQLRSDARSEEEVAVAALNQAMGIDVNAPTRVAERREAPRVELELKRALEISTESRPEIPVVLRGIAIAREGVAYARAEFLPSVSVQAGFSNVTGTGVQNADVGAGGIFLTQDLYAGGRRRGQLRSAEAGVRSAEAQAQQVCDLVAFEVNAAYRYFEDARERIEAARAVYLQAAENLRLVSSRSEAGDATPAEVVEARASETKSEQTFNASIYQYQRALARLEYAVGRPLPTSPGEVPAATAEAPGVDAAPAPPAGGSPFRPSRGGGLPGLPDAPTFTLPSAPPALPAPTPTRPPTGPRTGDDPGLFGPPSSLSRPPYEANSPYGTRP